MNILYISYNGATEPLFQSQGIPYIEGASNQGSNFLLLTFEKKCNLKSNNPIFIRIKNRLSENKIRWIFLKFHKRPIIFSKPYDLLQGIVVSCFLVFKFKIDIIQARGLFSALIALPVCFVRRKILIFDIRSKLYEAYAISGKWKKNGFMFKLVEALEKICISYARAVVVETNTHKKEIDEFVTKKKLNKITEDIPCCVDLSRFQNIKFDEVDESKFLISYVGSLSGWYCFKETINFLKSACKILSFSQLVILTKDNPEFIFQYAKQNLLYTDSIKVYNADPEELPYYLANSHAGIVFRQPYTRLSSFPVKIGEYLAAGIPVILNKGMGDVEKFILDNGVGVVVNDFNDDDFTQAFFKLLALKKDKNIRQRCLAAAKLLSVENGTKKYVNLYNKLSPL